MLQIDVTVPELGEPTVLEGGVVILGDEKSVGMLIGNEDGPACAVQMPAIEALRLSRRLFRAARQADPEGTSLMAQLKDAAS